MKNICCGKEVMLDELRILLNIPLFEKEELDEKKTKICVRRGINGSKYSACDKEGSFIGNFSTLGDVRKHWAREIHNGQVVLIRELNKNPDLTNHLNWMKCQKNLQYRTVKRG